MTWGEQSDRKVRWRVDLSAKATKTQNLDRVRGKNPFTGT